MTSEANRSVLIVDITEGAVRAVIPTQSGGSNIIAIIDMRTRPIVGHLPSGKTPDGIAYTTGVFADVAR